MASTSSLPALSRLRTTSIVILASIVIQLGLGVAMLSGHWSLTDTHATFGYLTFVVSLLAAFFAWQYSSADEGGKGIFMHTVSMPVLALIQIGLAEAGQGNEVVKWIHVVLGVAFLVMAIGLFANTSKKLGR